MEQNNTARYVITALAILLVSAVMVGVIYRHVQAQGSWPAIEDFVKLVLAVEREVKEEQTFGGVVQDAPTYTTSTTSAITVTAAGDVQVAATSSRRAGLIISNPTETPVWINLNQDIAATSGQGIAISATTSPFKIGRDLLYVGAVRATADTQVSISVVEFND